MAPLANSEFCYMKKSSEWVRQPGLDKKLDQLVEERGCTPAELIVYDAAKALDIEPGGEFYKKVRDWKQRRAAERDAPVLEVQPHVQAAFREVVERFTSDAMNAFLHAVRTVGGDLDRVATLRVTDAERRADDAVSEVNGLVDNWVAAEAARDAALARVAELEEALAQNRRRAEMMAVRLEERDAFLNGFKLKMTSGGPAPSPTDRPDGRAMAANAAIVGHGQVGSVTAVVTTPASAMTKPVEQSAPVLAGKLDQPPGIEPDRSTDSQVEMPLVTSDDADPAKVGDGGRG